MHLVCRNSRYICPYTAVVPTDNQMAPGETSFPTNPIFKQAILIDDEQVSNFIARHWLEKNGLAKNVVECTSAQEGLEWFAHNRVGESTDLILLDIHMPDMDGFEFLEQVFQDPNSMGKQAYVFLLTSSLFVGDAAQAGRFPVAGYLIKPLTEEKLQQIVHSVQVAH